MTTPTPPPIYDADELRAKAEAAIASSSFWITRWVEDSAFMLEAGVSREDTAHIAANSPEVTIALLDERATLLARVEAAEKFDPERYSAAIPNLLIAAWDAGVVTALGECLSDGIEFDDDEVKALYAKNPHRPNREEA